jgi:hypothetical protein
MAFSGTTSGSTFESQALAPKPREKQPTRRPHMTLFRPKIFGAEREPFEFTTGALLSFVPRGA